MSGRPKSQSLWSRSDEHFAEVVFVRRLRVRLSVKLSRIDMRFDHYRVRCHIKTCACSSQRLGKLQRISDQLCTP